MDNLSKAREYKTKADDDSQFYMDNDGKEYCVLNIINNNHIAIEHYESHITEQANAIQSMINDDEKLLKEIEKNKEIEQGLCNTIHDMEKEIEQLKQDRLDLIQKIENKKIKGIDAYGDKNTFINSGIDIAIQEIKESE